MKPEVLRVLAVDDHPIVREGLRWMLGNGSGIEIVAEAGDVDEALRVAAQTPVDVMLLDIDLPGRSGLDGLSEIRAQLPGLPVVMLSMSDDPAYVEEAVRSGATGYLVKNAPRDELMRAVRAAAQGDGYIQAEVTRPLLARFAAEFTDPGQAPSLSPREGEVITLAAQGAANKQIATALGLSEATVKGYLRQVYEKLGAADRAQAVAIALRHRLIT